MSLLRKLAKGVAAGAAAGVARSATDNLLNNRNNRQGQQQQQPQQQAPPPQQFQQSVQQQQPAQPPQPSVIEGAFANLLGSATRFVDNANSLLGACTKCNNMVAAGAACEECGTVAPALAGMAAAETGPTSCNNCGAPLASSNAVCEYCAI